jgi:hypothetical protein
MGLAEVHCFRHRGRFVFQRWSPLAHAAVNPVLPLVAMIETLVETVPFNFYIPT